MDLAQTIAIYALPLLFGITLHEVAHGWMAYRLGDPTAKMLGRITLNPVKHIDPIGTLLVPAVLVYMGGFLFGWAKPVPVSWRNLRHPRRDPILVAMAGPVANLLMAFFWALVAKIALIFQGALGLYAQPMLLMGVAGISVNIFLMLLNCLPIPPLDGSRVVSSLLPGPLAWQYERLEPYGLIILLVLLLTGTLMKILYPLFLLFLGLFETLFSL